MSNNELRDMFCPTTEKVNKYWRRLLDIMTEQKEKKSCSVCIYCKPPDPTLPGYVTDYGYCIMNMVCFPSRVCGLTDEECKFYTYNSDQEQYFRDKIDSITRTKQILI